MTESDGGKEGYLLRKIAEQKLGKSFLGERHMPPPAPTALVGRIGENSSPKSTVESLRASSGTASKDARHRLTLAADGGYTEFCEVMRRRWHVLEDSSSCALRRHYVHASSVADSATPDLLKVCTPLLNSPP
jgi:hypothetical protein